ncbi:MAG: imidazole glycerol phosphate synthase subunit HisH [Akkermansiaceae bacterium]|nr:imidazole glycerol phosphate synthase subunit HisH [Akkermansiaceae bacterium]
MKVAIVKYNAGNIRSVVNALRRVGVDPCVTDDPEELRRADRVVFPGQGEAAGTMAYLRESGLSAVIRSLTQPVLGICIGQQLLCEHSAEGDTPCLGVFPGTQVQHFAELWPGAPAKVPHIGWNTIRNLSSPLFDGVREGDFVYFIHSYCAPLSPYTTATTEYGGVKFSAAMRRGSFYATQFHPEKSGAVGERMLHNFIHLCHD